MSSSRQRVATDALYLPADRLEAATPVELLRWAVDRWRDRVALVTSFQAGGMVLLDMAARAGIDLRVLTIDTGRLPEETFELVERVRARYGVEVGVLFPDADEVEAMVRRHGPNLFRDSLERRLECCATRKSAPLRRALEGLDAWITGARRAQAASRSTLPKASADSLRAGVAKLAPLADWSDADVWCYLRRHEVPYHALYDQGYASIGCAPCTRPIERDEHPRAGRWWWESDAPKECGLHLDRTTVAAAGGEP